MNGIEIRDKINRNLAIIEAEAIKGQFVLSEKAQKALEENMRLREECEHVYDTRGVCIYCESLYRRND